MFRSLSDFPSRPRRSSPPLCSPPLLSLRSRSKRRLRCSSSLALTTSLSWSSRRALSSSSLRFCAGLVFTTTLRRCCCPGCSRGCLPAWRSGVRARLRTTTTLRGPEGSGDLSRTLRSRPRSLLMTESVLGLNLGLQDPRVVVRCAHALSVHVARARGHHRVQAVPLSRVVDQLLPRSTFLAHEIRGAHYE